ncbi:MAG TPA: energy transducer TonB [Candidatus Angelobacter sp.]
MKVRIPHYAVLLVLLLGTIVGEDTPKDLVQLKPEVAETLLVHKVNPAYPQMAKIAHVDGDVVLKATIGKKGDVESVRAVSGHPILIQSAMDAVRQWKYKPYVVNGKPVAVETTVTVKYRL